MSDPFRVILSPEAATDLEAIYAYIAQDSPANAAKMVERVLAAIEDLRATPHRAVIEHSSPRLTRPVRSIAVRPYIVYFRIDEPQRTIRVLTVRHGARRPPRF